LARPLYSSHFPLARLLQLVVLLQTERCPNARRLAEVCEVSRRTIYRDLAVLGDAGISVTYRPDRQGYELARGLFQQPLRIEDREVVALLVLCGGWADGEELGLGELADRALSKLIQSLPGPSRQRLQDTAEVVSARTGQARENSARRAVHGAILQAILQRKQVRVWYRESGVEEPEATKLAIYRLARLEGHWSLVGRSSRHCRVLTLPLQSIIRAELTEDETVIPPRFNLQRYCSSRSAMPDASSQASSG
jgi:predicted DNA-binding transcriptional regulator YafY